MRDFSNIVVAFEAPPWLLESPDVRVTQDTNNVITYVLVKGCKACQQLSSKCVCPVPMVSEPWVYDREQGLNLAMVTKLGFRDKLRLPPEPVFAKPQAVKATTKVSRLKTSDLMALMEGSGDFERGANTKEEQVQNNLDVLPINPALLNWLEQFRKHVHLVFSYPIKKLDAMQTLWKEKGKVLHIRPIDNADTDRGSASCTITIPRPAFDEMLADYPAALKAEMQVGTNGSPATITFGDVRLGLQLYFDHDFYLHGPLWDDEIVQRLKAEAGLQ